MGRRVVSEGQAFQVQFETSGGGSYFAIVHGEERGPFTSQEAALRHVQNKLENQLGGGTSIIDEVDVATEQAMREADLREGEGTLGSDGARAAEAAAREEDEEEMRLLQEDRARREREREINELMVTHGIAREEAESIRDGNPNEQPVEPAPHVDDETVFQNEDGSPIQ